MANNAGRYVDGTIRQWYEEGRASGARWLAVDYDAYESLYEPRYSSEEEKPKGLGGSSQQTHAIIDLTRPLEEQPEAYQEYIG